MKKKPISLRMPEPLVAKMETLAARFGISREQAFQLVVAAADEAQLIKGFAVLGGLIESPAKD